MKEGACIQSVIEILHSWDTQRFPLDRLCQQYFRNKRYMGSKDRQRVSNLVYNVMRNWGSLSWWTEKVGLPPTSRSLVLIHLKNKGIEKLFTGDLYHPEAPSVQEKKALQNSSKIQAGKNLPLSIQLNYPSWMETSLQNTFPHDFEQEMEALCQSAPFDLRVNPLLQTRESVQKELTHQGYETDLTSYSPYGLRSWKRFPLDQLSVFKRGAVEVQDESSQLVCLLSQVKPSHQVLDLCAGAGGKSLLLGALMKNKGHITATDIHDKRLKKCRDRLKRAKVQNTHCQVIDSENDAKLDSLKGKMDRVLVDAPCSGLRNVATQPRFKVAHKSSRFKGACPKARKTPQSSGALCETRRMAYLCNMLYP